jgi:hypothetical protein
VALNQLINVAVAEKLSGRAKIAKAKRILKRAGRGNAPVAGDRR